MSASGAPAPNTTWVASRYRLQPLQLWAAVAISSRSRVSGTKSAAVSAAMPPGYPDRWASPPDGRVWLRCGGLGWATVRSRHCRAKLTWITPATPVRRGRCGHRPGRFAHCTRTLTSSPATIGAGRTGFVFGGAHVRVSSNELLFTSDGLLSRVALHLTLGGYG